MDYEKKYNEALELAKSYYGQGCNEFLETIFPELRESEDERIRKFLLEYAIEMIAGLESDISLSTYDGIKGHDPDAEAELNQWQKARAYIEKQKDLFRDDTKKVEKQDYSSLTDLERAIHRGFLSAGVENVPVTIIKETANECKRTQTIANENANAEWSEEDKSFYDSIMCEVVKEGMHPTPAQANWFKSLPERFNFQSKQEWSEEDEKMWEHIISDLREFRDCETDEELVSDYEDEIAWLKSLPQRLNLPPTQEWSEKEKNEFAIIISIIEDAKADAVKQYPKCKALQDAYDRSLNFLEALRHRPHWRPTHF